MCHGRVFLAYLFEPSHCPEAICLRAKEPYEDAKALGAWRESTQLEPPLAKAGGDTMTIHVLLGSLRARAWKSQVSSSGSSFGMPR